MPAIEPASSSSHPPAHRVNVTVTGCPFVFPTSKPGAHSADDAIGRSLEVTIQVTLVLHAIQFLCSVVLPHLDAPVLKERKYHAGVNELLRQHDATNGTTVPVALKRQLVDIENLLDQLLASLSYVS